MLKWTTRFLPISILLLLCSCRSNPAQRWQTVAIEDASYSVPYFANADTDYVYKANISVYGHELSGILIVKKINIDTHRVVFTTDFGNKLLDLQIAANDFKVNAIVEELNRDMLIKTLVEDFRLMLREQYSIAAQYESDGVKILQPVQKGFNDYLFVPKDAGQLSQIRRFAKRKQKIKITYIAENNIFAQKIVIEHFNIKLKIELNYFKNQF